MPEQYTRTRKAGPLPLPSLLRKWLNNPLLLPFYLPSLLYAFAQGLLAPILPLYVADLGVSYGLIGIVLAGESLGALISDVPVGILLGRLGRKRVMSLGLSCAALSTTALFWTSSIPQLLILRLVSGFGRAAFSVARHAYAADATAVSGRGRAIALLGGVFRVGSFAGPAIGGSLAAAFGLRAPFLLYGGATAIALVAVTVFVRREEKTSQRPLPSSRAHSNRFMVTLKERHRVLASAGSGQLFAQMIRAGRSVMIPLYAADVIGLDAQAIGLIISIGAAIDMSLFYPTGVIMDRLGRKFAIVPSFLIQAIGLSLVPLTSSFIGLTFATILIGLGNGLSSGTMMTLGADLAPPEARGEFLGVWRLIGDAGFTGGPLVAGAIADLVVLQTAVLTMAGTGAIAALIFALLVPETLQKHERDAGFV
jgi:MFS family permease